MFNIVSSKDIKGQVSFTNLVKGLLGLHFQTKDMLRKGMDVLELPDENVGELIHVTPEQKDKLLELYNGREL